LRIIAGACKGRRLFAPDGLGVRPTSDKVKGAVFSMIAARVEGAAVLDLFSGTGGLGLEALSRGASFCRFCDNSPESLAFLRKNVLCCGFGDRCEIVRGDYTRALAGRDRAWDIIFLDPPYRAGCYTDCLERIASDGCLAEDGLVVAEHDARFSFQEYTPDFEKIREKKYGATGVTIFQLNGKLL
jgi:16S rRNA (guanine(966)-N(2))-methyltransferase RsmD